MGTRSHARLAAAVATCALASTMNAQVRVLLVPCTTTPEPGASVRVNVFAQRLSGYALSNVRYSLSVTGSATGGSFAASQPHVGAPAAYSSLADRNSDLQNTTADLWTFASAFQAFDPSADVNVDGGIDLVDVFDMWNAWKVAAAYPAVSLPGSLAQTFEYLQTPKWAGGTYQTTGSLPLGSFIVNVSPNAAIGTSLTLTGTCTAARIYPSSSTSFDQATTAQGSTVVLTVSPSGSAGAAAPSISQQPLNTSVCAGGSASFTVVAANATSYQWQVLDQGSWLSISNGPLTMGGLPWGVVSGATGSQCILTNTSGETATVRARCVVANSCTSVTSTAADMLAASAPAITQHPVGGTFCTPQTVSLGVHFSGSSPTVLWQVDDPTSPSGWSTVQGGDIFCGGMRRGAAAIYGSGGISTLDFDISEDLRLAPQECRAVRFRALVSNSCGSVTSNFASVELLASNDASCSTCPACAADYDANGGIDGADLAAFFADYEGGVGCSDVDANGGVDGADLAAFFAAYEAGGC